MEEDIRLMEENLLNLKKWAQISRSFIGRNQHQVKNRFIVLIQREIDIDKATIRRLLKKNQITIFIKDTLRNLQIKLQGNKSYQSYEDLQPSLSQSETTTISDENFSQLMQEIDDLNDQFNISQFYENDFGGSFTELYLNCNAWLKN